MEEGWRRIGTIALLVLAGLRKRGERGMVDGADDVAGETVRGADGDAAVRGADGDAAVRGDVDELVPPAQRAHAGDEAGGERPRHDAGSGSGSGKNPRG